MTRVADGMADLAHCRAVLIRVTAGLEVESLDYRPFADSKSNGEILLHIAGFEFLAIAAAYPAGRANLDPSLWPSLKSGFAREAGFAPPQARTLDEYLGRLDVVRQWTKTVLTASPSTRRTRLDGHALEQVTRLLSASDADEDPDRYRRLAASVLASVTDDGTLDEDGSVDVPTVLTLHEAYHRGQITLNKYIRSRAQRGAMRP